MTSPTIRGVGLKSFAKEKNRHSVGFWFFFHFLYNLWVHSLDANKLILMVEVLLRYSSLLFSFCPFFLSKNIITVQLVADQLCASQWRAISQVDLDPHQPQKECVKQSRQLGIVVHAKNKPKTKCHFVSMVSANMLKKKRKLQQQRNNLKWGWIVEQWRELRTNISEGDWWC